MKINIEIDDKLLELAFKYSDAKTNEDLIHEALKEFVCNRKKKNLLELKGKIVFEKDYDYKTSRRGRSNNSFTT